MLRMAQNNFVITLFNPAVNGLGAERFTAVSVHGQCECEGSLAPRRQVRALTCPCLPLVSECYPSGLPF